MRRVLKLLAWILLPPSLALAVGFGALLALAYRDYGRAQDVAPPTDGAVGLWLGHRWVGEPQTPTAYDALAEQFRRHGISDVFLHVGPLDPDGGLAPAKHPNAAAFAAEMHRRLPALRIQAWIGQRERQGGGPLDLSDADSRRRIVDSAGRFLDLGYDGIHYNIEPLTGDNAGLLDLLERTLAMTRRRGRLLSLAAYEIEPLPGMKWLARTMVPQAYLWTSAEYRAIAERVDQLAVMTYDTALPRDWLYGAFIADQTRRLRDAVDNRVTLFIGVPTYFEPSWAFHPEAENMVSGLLGARLGFADLAPEARGNTGVAIYIDGTTDADEWRTFERLWLGRP